MKKYYYDSRFEIEYIDYENILKNFSLYKIDMKLSEFFDKEKRQENYSHFFKKIKELKNLKAFYLNKSLFLLGDKNFKIKSNFFTETFVCHNNIQKIITKEELLKVDKLTILNLLIKSIPNNIFENDEEKDVKYIDSSYLYLFICEKSKKIFKFFKCRFEKDNFFEDKENYILNLTQTTFAPEELFWNKKKLKKAIKIGFDIGTRILVPNEKGKYYERNPFNRTVESSFLITNPKNLGELRSYYFTLIKNIIEEYLSEYISLKFNNLENFEYFPFKSKRKYFQSKVKKINKVINVYRVVDWRFSDDGKEEKIIAEDDFEVLKKEIESHFSEVKLINKGIANIDTLYEDDGNWNIFLLNTPTGEDLVNGKKLAFDLYKYIKEKFDIISNGLCLKIMSTKKISEKGKKAILIRTIEELFLKDCLKNEDISSLNSQFKIFRGITCIQYFDRRIKKLSVFENGKIKVESSPYLENNELNIEFNKLLKKFNLEQKVIDDFGKSLDEEDYNPTTLNLKFIKINGKDIYISETGMRVYFDSNEFENQYYKDIQKVNKKGEKMKGISKALEGFLGMTMSVRINRKENLYYSLYDTGITGTETFSPNIKRLICQDELTEEDYSIFCESLIFKYLSNGSKLATYPFFFKLTSEIIKDC